MSVLLVPSNLLLFDSVTFDIPVPARPQDHHQSIQRARKPLEQCWIYVIGPSGDLGKPRGEAAQKKVVYPKKSGCRGVNCASRGVNERENWRQSFRTDQETHPGVLYTNFYGTLSLKNNRLGRLLEIVVYPQFQGVPVFPSNVQCW